MPLSAMIGDKRLFINTEIKEKCLDIMREKLKEAGLQVEAIDLVLLGISVAEKDRGSAIIWPGCNDIGKKSEDKTMIISLNRLKDEQLGALLAFAVNNFGANDLQENINKAIELWQGLAEEGLKKLYCQYFIDFTNGEIDLQGFLHKINELVERH